MILLVTQPTISAKVCLLFLQPVRHGANSTLSRSTNAGDRRSSCNLRSALRAVVHATGSGGTRRLPHPRRDVLQRGGLRRSGRVERPVVATATLGMYDACRGAANVMSKFVQETF